MKRFPLLSLFSFLFYRSEAKNNWTQPCFDGTCSYDIAQSETSMGGTFTINGSSTAISDITPAAGWSILNCSTSTNSQTIQVVCTDESKGCNHLFQQGAEHTIVRLPEDCGSGPFVRVAKHWSPGNQTLPAGVTSKIRRSNGTEPQVHLLQIDTNFNESSSSGQVVGFSLAASSANPGSSSALSVPRSRRRMRDLHSYTATNFGDDPFHSSKNFKRLGSFNETGSKSGNAKLNESFELFNKTLSCAGDEHENEEITLKVNVTTDFDLTVTVSFEAAGSLIHPTKVTSYGATVAIDGSFDASLSIDADLVGTLDTGEIALFTVGLPVLTIDDILSIGPSFTLNAAASATFELEAELSLGLSYDLNGLSFTVGSSSSSNPGFTPNNSPVTFDVDPSITAKANFEAHLIPTIDFGISAFGSKADIFVDLDAALELELNATAGVELTGDTDGNLGVTEGAQACLDLSSPISFNVGATGDFFGLIDDTLSVPIFEKTFDIYQKCVTQAATTTPAPVSATPSKPTSTATPTAIPPNLNSCFMINGILAYVPPSDIAPGSPSIFHENGFVIEPCSSAEGPPAISNTCVDVNGMWAALLEGTDTPSNLLALQQAGVETATCPVGTFSSTATGPTSTSTSSKVSTTSEPSVAPTSTAFQGTCITVSEVQSLVFADTIPGGSSSTFTEGKDQVGPCNFPGGMPKLSGVCINVTGIVAEIIGEAPSVDVQASMMITGDAEFLGACPTGSFTISNSCVMIFDILAYIPSSQLPAGSPSTFTENGFMVEPCQTVGPPPISDSCIHLGSMWAALPANWDASASNALLLQSEGFEVETCPPGVLNSSPVTSTSTSKSMTSSTPITTQPVSLTSITLMSISSTTSHSSATASTTSIASASSLSKASSLPTSSDPISTSLLPKTSSVAAPPSSSPTTTHSSTLNSTSSTKSSTVPSSSSIAPSIGSTSTKGPFTTVPPDEPSVISKTSITSTTSVAPTLTSTRSSSLASSTTTSSFTNVTMSSSTLRTSSVGSSSSAPSETTLSPASESTSSMSVTSTPVRIVEPTVSTIEPTSSSSQSVPIVGSPSGSPAHSTYHSSDAPSSSSILGTLSSPVVYPSPSSSVPVVTTESSTSSSSSVQQQSSSAVPINPGTNSAYPSVGAGSMTSFPATSSASGISGASAVSNTLLPSAISTKASMPESSSSIWRISSSSTSQAEHPTATTSPHSNSATNTPRPPSRPPPPPPPPPPSYKSGSRPNNKGGNYHKPGQIHRPSQHQRPSQFQNSGPHMSPAQPEMPNQYHGPAQPANSHPAPGQYQGPPQMQGPSPYQSSAYGGNMYESVGPSQSQDEPEGGYYYEEPSAYQPYGGFGGFGGSSRSQRLGDGGLQSWTESSGYYRKQSGRRDLKARRGLAARDAVTNAFSCPASNADTAEPISGSNDE